MNIQLTTQIMSSDSIAALAKAMVKVHKAIMPAAKDRMNPFTRSRYATLGAVMESCRAALLDAGVWLTQLPVPVDGGEANSSIGLLTKLVHAESGEWQASLLVMPVPKNDPQGFGSALTYARRYGLSAMVGIVTEDDDDGNGACIQPKSSTQVCHTEPVPVAAKVAATPAGRLEPVAAMTGSGDPSVNRTKVNTAATAVNPLEKINLPRIDGVSFSQVAGQDGISYITATGDTRNKTGILKEAGFRWDAARKLGWKCQQPIPA